MKRKPQPAPKPPSPPASKAGRKPKHPKFTPAEREIIRKMSGYGLTMSQMGDVFGLSHDTLERRAKQDPELRRAIESGRAAANLDVAKTLYHMASSGKHPACTIFWCKVRLGWKEGLDLSTENPIKVEVHIT